MSFNLANRSLAERAMIEDEKARLYELWQANLGKAKADAARLIGEKPSARGAGPSGCAVSSTACRLPNTPTWSVPK